MTTEAQADRTRTAPAPLNDPFAFWTYADLEQRRIVGSRTDLHRKQKFWGFPMGIVLSGGGTGASVLFRVSDVTAWIEEREAKALRSGPVERRGGPGRPRKVAIAE